MVTLLGRFKGVRVRRLPPRQLRTVAVLGPGPSCCGMVLDWFVITIFSYEKVRSWMLSVPEPPQRLTSAVDPG